MLFLHSLVSSGLTDCTGGLRRIRQWGRGLATRLHMPRLRRRSIKHFMSERTPLLLKHRFINVWSYEETLLSETQTGFKPITKRFNHLCRLCLLVFAILIACSLLGRVGKNFPPVLRFFAWVAFEIGWEIIVKHARVARGCKFQATAILSGQRIEYTIWRIDGESINAVINNRWSCGYNGGGVHGQLTWPSFPSTGPGWPIRRLPGQSTAVAAYSVILLQRLLVISCQPIGRFLFVRGTNCCRYFFGIIALVHKAGQTTTPTGVCLPCHLWLIHFVL